LAAPGDLSLLLRRLAGTESALEKMKLAARAWRTIRALPKKDRLALASRIGLEGAEEALERLADAKQDGRISSAGLLKVLEEAEKSDPNRLKDLLREVRDPRFQKDLLRGAARVLGEQLLATSESSPPASPPERGGDLSPATAAEVSQFVPSPSAAPTTPGTAPSPAPAAPPQTAWAAPHATVSETSRQSAEIEGAPPPISPPDFAAAPPEQYSVEAPSEVFPALTLEGETSESAAGAFARRLRAARLVSRFRLLRAGVEETRGLPFESLQEVVESFPKGWARRRALASLLRAGIPESVPESLRLIESLEPASARSWCFSALLERGPLSASEIEELREKAPPAVRRRMRVQAVPRRAI